MIKRSFFYFLLFGILVGVNFFLSYQYYRQSRRLIANQKVLDEIAQAVNPLSQFTRSSAPLNPGTIKTEFKQSDSRAANLRAFFRKYNSDLYDYAEFIVAVSDLNQFDYRLLPAIAMQESNLCRYIPESSHNCWGWGIYGTTVTRFSSYEEAITTVARGIKNEYIDKGMLTASAIMKKYTPPSTGSWAYGVNQFLRMLE